MGSGDGGGGVITWRERRENAIKKVEDNVRGSFLVELSRLHGERCHSMILERQVIVSLGFPRHHRRIYNVPKF